ncbi:hypothetical protein BVX98_01395 [bacterium F11]|nr:hypothetical protein BVX98_01395 [bacterium F11]
MNRGYLRKIAIITFVGLFLVYGGRCLILAAPPSDKLNIFVVNYPLRYFAERIAKDQARVVFPAPRDVDPAFWIPKQSVILAYQKADLILLNGASYAKWISKVSLPPSRLVKTSRIFKDQLIATPGGVTHSHGTGGEHSHSGTAFTTWLDFSLAIQQAEDILKTLIRKRPASKAEFEKNFADLKADLMFLDEAVKKVVSKNPKQPFVSSHPVYQYFSRRYGLTMESVMWEPGEFPSDTLWKELKMGLKAFPAKWMIWEGNPLPKSIGKLKEMGVKSLVFDPCGNVPDEGDFLSVMKKNIEELKKAY